MAVVELLRIVIRRAESSLVADPTGARPECAAALRGVQPFAAVQARPEPDEFLSFQSHQSDRKTSGIIVDWLSGLFAFLSCDQSSRRTRLPRNFGRESGRTNRRYLEARNRSRLRGRSPSGRPLPASLNAGSSDLMSVCYSAVRMENRWGPGSFGAGPGWVSYWAQGSFTLRRRRDQPRAAKAPPNRARVDGLGNEDATEDTSEPKALNGES